MHNLGGELSETEAKSLFQIFHRAKRAETGGQSGWGIGLALVKGLAESHGGRAWVESATGKGTRFTVELKRELGRGDKGIEKGLQS